MGCDTFVYKITTKNEDIILEHQTTISGWRFLDEINNVIDVDNCKYTSIEGKVLKEVIDEYTSKYNIDYVMKVDIEKDYMIYPWW